MSNTDYLAYALARTNRQPTASLLRLLLRFATEKLGIIDLCAPHDEAPDEQLTTDGYFRSCFTTSRLLAVRETNAAVFLDRLTNIHQEDGRYPITIHKNTDAGWDYFSSVTSCYR